jgi:hypothetical protein
LNCDLANIPALGSFAKAPDFFYTNTKTLKPFITTRRLRKSPAGDVLQ